MTSSSTQTYLTKLKALSDQLVELQKPIRILDAIKWPVETQERFFTAGAKCLPDMGRSYYEQSPLAFDQHKLTDAFIELERDVVRQLGNQDALGRILRDTIDQYRLVLEMLGARGTARFGELSRQLYGSPSDCIAGDNKTLLEIGQELCQVFSLPAASQLTQLSTRQQDAHEATAYLSKRMDEYFGAGTVNVTLSDDIVSDAAAGGDCLKVNRRSTFTQQDLNVLEVHEGWVHIGTTLNGRAQPWATWLSVGSPRITAIQEGMAVLMETLTFSSFPKRAQRVSDRVVAVDMAERGADFIELYRFFRDRGDSEQDSYRVAQRVFRGGTVTGGSVFTKDISYVKGFVENVGFIRSAILAGQPEMIPLLYLGKLALDDIPALQEHLQLGHIVAPRFLPPMFKNLNGLYVWFGFSSSIAGLDNVRVRKHFSRLFSDPKNRH
ncbi:flavohemoglobin expression-modulating QEGLA motif protein [Gilvimarinus polysaccharolyticus]|uniref:flavohemoglobin expression-modulating QEGLA motif protein n=1 Tax=Gilvimarinus polysaccharolyticus TaxID=863921 RepID=UPI00067394C2|nr:flavohemoglobin expression-modulating QEGLA motif protein [Gilvimarinus polysaccharolyticus]